MIIFVETANDYSSGAMQVKISVIMHVKTRFSDYSKQNYVPVLSIKCEAVCYPGAVSVRERLTKHIFRWPAVSVLVYSHLFSQIMIITIMVKKRKKNKGKVATCALGITLK